MTTGNENEGNPWRVLWLEDDTRSFEIAARKLTEQGFSVTMVPDLKQFRSHLKKSAFDLVIVDIRGETFNGLELVRSGKVDFGEAKVCFLSGYLDDPAIQTVLEGLDSQVFVLDKAYPFDEGSVEVGLEAQLLRILEAGEGHTNKSYFASVNAEAFDKEHGSTTYEDYIALNPSEKNFVKNAILDLAEEKITKLSQKGYRWFLVCGPKGRIIDKSKSYKSMSSHEISEMSLVQGYPCVTEFRSSRVEEVRRPASCSGMYEYYFSLSVSFRGTSDEKYDIHFDSGSESSWFDLQFLKRFGIGTTGDTNSSDWLHTSTGPRRVWFFSAEREVAIYDQPNGESPSLTDLVVRGIGPDWPDLPFSGYTDNPEEELCRTCRRTGRCQKRVGLLGQDVLRGPRPLKVILDGSNGSTSVVDEDN